MNTRVRFYIDSRYSRDLLTKLRNSTKKKELHEAAKKARGGLDAPNNPELAETDQRGINLTLDNDSRIEDLYSHIEVARYFLLS